MNNYKVMFLDMNGKCIDTKHIKAFSVLHAQETVIKPIAYHRIIVRKKTIKELTK